MAGPGAAAAAAAAARMAADMAKQAQESAAMRGAGPSVAASSADTYDPSYCSVKLPHPKPLAPIESEVSHICNITSAVRPSLPKVIRFVLYQACRLDIFMKTQGRKKLKLKILKPKTQEHFP